MLCAWAKGPRLSRLTLLCRPSVVREQALFVISRHEQTTIKERGLEVMEKKGRTREFDDPAAG